MPKQRIPVPAGNEATIARANALLPAANRGDQRALAELRALLDGAPELWIATGNLAAHAERAMINSVAGRNEVVAEAIIGRLLCRSP